MTEVSISPPWMSTALSSAPIQPSGCPKRVQRVATATGPGRVRHALQNLGAITNRGWEMQGTLGLAPVAGGTLAVGGTLTLVESRVRALARGYTGDLRPGDRTLEVPASTAGLTASYVRGGTAVAAGVARAADWVNYDRLALTEAALRGELPRSDLREFLREYRGVSRVRASLSHRLHPALTLTLAGDNLLGRQLGEPDNVTVLPGRTLTIGVGAEF